MKKRFFILVIGILLLSLSSCVIDPEASGFSLLEGIGDIIREIPEASELSDAYDASLDEYRQTYEYLEENQDSLADQIKQGVSDMIDKGLEDENQADLAKEGVSELVDIGKELIFGGFHPIWPAETYYVNTLYCYKDANTTGSIYHSCHNSYLTGIDIGGGGRKDVEIYAVEDGKVILSEYSETSGFGNWIKIEHENGMVSVYAHLAERRVKEGDTVKKRDVIGIMGNSSAKYNVGIHLHFELADENKGGDAWLNYYKDEYKKDLIYEANVITNNEKNNSDHVVSQWIKDNYEKESEGTYYYYKEK